MSRQDSLLSSLLPIDKHFITVRQSVAYLACTRQRSLPTTHVSLPHFIPCTLASTQIVVRTLFQLLPATNIAGNDRCKLQKNTIKTEKNASHFACRMHRYWV